MNMPNAKSVGRALAALCVVSIVTCIPARGYDGDQVPAPALGIRTSAVLLLQYADDASPRYNKAVIDAAFKSAKSFYEDASYGQFSLAWDVFGPVMLAMNHPCDATSAYVNVPAAARAAAAAAAINLAAYQTVLLAGTGCPESPLPWDAADLAGPYIYVYGDGTLTPQVLAHELGHNLGLKHANYLNCQNVPYIPCGTGCTSVEYGDPIEVMGSRYHDFNAFHKELLGWIKPVIVSESGTYELGPIEISGAAPRALKVVPPGATRAVYIEYRQPIGFDMPDSELWYEAFYQGATIHLGGDPTELLNMYPSTNTASLPILLGGPSLLTGMTYVDPAIQFAISALSASRESLRVQITFLPPSDEPTVSFGQPLDGQSVYGSVPVALTAADTTGIERVELYIDGMLFGTRTTSASTLYLFEWNPTEAASNAHQLTGVAYANNGAKSSQSINVTVHASPVVTLGASTTSLVPGASVTMIANVTVDPGATVRDVTFTVAGAFGPATNLSSSSGTAKTYRATWSPGDLGAFSVVAVVTDSQGYTGFSNALVLSVAPVAISTGSVVSAANFAPGVTPGALVSIFGGGFSNSSLSAAGIPLPLSMGGASVTFNGIPAPLLYVSPTQLNVQVPWAVNGQTFPNPSVRVTVTGANGSAQTDVRFLPTAPSVFRLSDGARAVAFNSDGSLVAPSGSISGIDAHPGRVGDIIAILGTGLGVVTPPALTGNNSLDVLRSADAVPTVAIGGVPAYVSFAGLSPQFVGVDQLNVVIPDAVVPGDSVYLTVKGTNTNDTAVLAIVK